MRVALGLQTCCSPLHAPPLGLAFGLLSTTDNHIQGIDTAALETFAFPARSPLSAEGAFMRFNPPPNWPQPPAGWSPPPDWEPDPSWPQPPYGWQLWVAEDEFVISPYRAAASRAPSTQPWHRRTVSIVLLLIFFFPVGLVLLWMRPDWSVRRRGIVTGLVGLFVIIVAVSPNPPPTTTAVLNTTTAGGTASSQPLASSQPASPSAAAPTTVATMSPTPTPSAPPKTTAAAPSYTPPPAPAPVHVTKAPPPPPPPQPVQTVAQPQGCYPKTNSGNCYTPGEYCRDSDHNASGVDADGDAIKCEDNDGWRWERV